MFYDYKDVSMDIIKVCLV